MEDGKIICDWAIEIVTPVHIGTAQEKHWQNNLDFIIRNNKVYFLDETKLIDEFGIDNYSDAVANNKLKDIIPFNKIDKLSLDVKNITGNTREIKQHIKNSLSGKPIIPGSSLKGALRSIIFAYLMKENYDAKGEKDIFGEISQDFMRYIEVFDVEFDKTEIFNTKIYNLKKEEGGFIGSWKHRKNSISHFLVQDKKTGKLKYEFTTGYECISPRELAKLKIVFNFEAFIKAKEKKKVKIVNGLEDILNEDFEKNILKIIKEHNDNYLRKELDFFEKYNQAQYGKNVFDDYKYYADEFLKEGKTGLRLAAGSGFHSITGDWQFDTHEINGIYRRRGQYNKKKSAKSRKLAFEYIKNDGYYFYPIGFIGLEKINND